MSKPSAGPRASAREYTSRNVDESTAVWLPREIQIGERVGLRVWMVGFCRETGRAIIRTERKPADGGNRLNSGRYRHHVARCEEMGTACLANALARIERENSQRAEHQGQGTWKASGDELGRVAAGNRGALDFLDLLTSAIEKGLTETEKLAAEQIFSSASPETVAAAASTAKPTAANGDGNGDSTGPGGHIAESPLLEGEPATVFLDYPVGGSEKSNAQFLLDTVNKAIKKRWDVSDDMKAAVVTSLSTLMINELQRKMEQGGPDAKILLGVCRTVALLEKQNQTDELKITPSLHLHATQPNEQRTIQPAEVRAAIARAVIAELRKRDIAGRRIDDDGNGGAGAGGDTVDGAGTGGDGGGNGAAVAG